MTDISPEAVERLAVLVAPLGKASGATRWQAAATLRALAARVAELEREIIDIAAAQEAPSDDR